MNFDNAEKKRNKMYIYIIIGGLGIVSALFASTILDDCDKDTQAKIETCKSFNMLLSIMHGVMIGMLSLHLVIAVINFRNTNDYRKRMRDEDALSRSSNTYASKKTKLTFLVLPMILLFVFVTVLFSITNDSIVNISNAAVEDSETFTYEDCDKIVSGIKLRDGLIDQWRSELTNGVPFWKDKTIMEAQVKIYDSYEKRAYELGCNLNE